MCQSAVSLGDSVLGEGELILSQTVAKLNRFWQKFLRKFQFLFFFPADELQSICDLSAVAYMPVGRAFLARGFESGANMPPAYAYKRDGQPIYIKLPQNGDKQNEGCINTPRLSIDESLIA